MKGKLIKIWGGGGTMDYKSPPTLSSIIFLRNSHTFIKIFKTGLN